MEFLLLLGLALVGLRVLALRDTRERIALLASHLQRHRIEPRMGQLIDGYLRAAGEPDPERAQSAWQNLAEVEQALAGELAQLATDLQGVWGERMRVCRWPVAVPHATRFFPHAGFDFRALVQIHAQGFATVLRNDEALPPPRPRLSCHRRAVAVPAQLPLVLPLALGGRCATARRAQDAPQPGAGVGVTSHPHRLPLAGQRPQQLKAATRIRTC